MAVAVAPCGRASLAFTSTHAAASLVCTVTDEYRDADRDAGRHTGRHTGRNRATGVGALSETCLFASA